LMHGNIFMSAHILPVSGVIEHQRGFEKSVRKQIISYHSRWWTSSVDSAIGCQYLVWVALAFVLPTPSSHARIIPTAIILRPWAIFTKPSQLCGHANHIVRQPVNNGQTIDSRGRKVARDSWINPEQIRPGLLSAPSLSRTKSWTRGVSGGDLYAPYQSVRNNCTKARSSVSIRDISSGLIFMF
jgi:hypothetical protein